MILMTGAVLMAPNSLYLMFWLPGVFLVITAVVGTKLQLCSLQMATYSKELQESVRRPHSAMHTPPGAGGGSLRGGEIRSDGEAGAPYPSADDHDHDDGDDGAAGFSHRLSDLTPRVPLLDAASLFWFSRPRLLLKLFQYTLFENSLSIALTIYSYWRVRRLPCVFACNLESCRVPSQPQISRVLTHAWGSAGPVLPQLHPQQPAGARATGACRSDARPVRSAVSAAMGGPSLPQALSVFHVSGVRAADCLASH